MRRKFVTACAALCLILLAAAAGYSEGTARAAEEEKKTPPSPQFREPTAEERQAVIAAIEGQLKAFKEDDFEKASRYQSAGLRKNVPNAETFRRMMKQSYPQFVNYRKVSFGQAHASQSGDVVQIRVTLTGEDNVTVRAMYVMVREDGEYRVGSVFGGTRPKVSPRDIA